MLIRETFLNATEGYQFGESEPYEPYTDNVRELFRDMQKEYGRCVSSVYVDGEDGPQKVGWVFQKTMEYEDSRRYDSGGYPRKPDTYVREVWVTLYDRYERRTTVETEYHSLGRHS